jgi:hypothetical protein
MWTEQLDERLTDLHRRNLGNAFIASFMRIDARAVRARLADLGLLKTKAPAGAAATETARFCETARLRAIDRDDDDGDDDLGEMVRLRGRPRGHLLSEAEIAKLYKRSGGRY